MEFLTKTECGAWLHERDIFSLPYGNPKPPGVSYLQFKLPPKREALGEFTYKIFSVWGIETNGLMAITEWHYDDEYEDDPTAALRQNHGEERDLREVPAMVFSSEEIELSADLAYLVIDRSWTAYWYLPNQTIALLWEGEIIDLWSPNPQVLASTQLILLEYDAPILHRRAGKPLWPDEQK